jgi:NitT/TauT family transport system ATP-binding protein
MTPHPGTLKLDLPILLDRPRDPLSIEFLEYQKQLLAHLGHVTANKKVNGATIKEGG